MGGREGGLGVMVVEGRKQAKTEFSMREEKSCFLGGGWRSGFAGAYFAANASCFCVCFFVGLDIFYCN